MLYTCILQLHMLVTIKFINFNVEVEIPVEWDFQAGHTPRPRCQLLRGNCYLLQLSRRISMLSSVDTLSI
jgi:hypothetical protein